MNGVRESSLDTVDPWRAVVVIAMTDPTNELVEEVDRDGNVLRVVPRSLMRAELLRHRSVFIAIVSSSGQLLVHQRSPFKDVNPSYWDIACGGVVSAGEEWEPAALRELAEEVGVESVELVDLGGEIYDDHTSLQVARCYLACTDGPFTFADGEVVQAHFADAAGVDELIATQPVCADSVALMLPRVHALLR